MTSVPHKIKRQAVFNWSGGKDSALALYYALQDEDCQVKKLLTSVNGAYNRVTMHGVRLEVLQEQARRIGIPLKLLILPGQPDMAAYEEAMKAAIGELRQEGITHGIFGDLFLEDVRRYRESKLAAAGMKALFPLWKKDTTETLHEFLDLGFKTMLVCVDASKLDSGFCGRIIDRDFIKDLPRGVDPCGENGEFHTFVFDGPIFKNPVYFEKGETVLREYDSPGGKGGKSSFWFTDIRLKKAEAL